MGLGGLREFAKQDTLDDLRPVLVNDAHVGGGTNTDAAQQSDRVLARQV
jgi:hypothetical protein